ncbi:GNAT family N-acetyltransferase [Deefgea sp. CFH1-16]|uniref:GNAT family N-acetyltransferase n=1 Tax=Deefgea sp. CFH1-16 TaxID=2675457 RepID=UPI0015F4D277|nr:GNAT family N-acetyltransferase [Deefgea sp. CFH1-16]MBM5573171.1 GNAT family N-acetyltransferase [Deefgea sp. CFH1-16]
MSFELRIACEADAKEITALVNRAYRPSPQDAGWTHEADLVAGERTSPEQLLSLFHEQSTILLLCLGPKIVACVHVQGGQSGAYIGMLTTNPTMQGRGLGKQMLLHAEAYATEHFEASIFKMSVLSSRPELLAFYERRGYVPTGEIEEYPLSAGVGQPIVAGIHVLSLAKTAANPLFHRICAKNRACL